jgi:hypothetical protein
MTLFTTNAVTAREMRDEIVRDLVKRETTLRDSIPKQKTKTHKAACYVAAEAIRVAAHDYATLVFVPKGLSVE